jgi:aminoglycoside phosphotransferase (APT) family kinase protein
VTDQWWEQIEDGVQNQYGPEWQLRRVGSAALFAHRTDPRMLLRVDAPGQQDGLEAALLATTRAAAARGLPVPRPADTGRFLIALPDGPPAVGTFWNQIPGPHRHPTWTDPDVAASLAQLLVRVHGSGHPPEWVMDAYTRYRLMFDRLTALITTGARTSEQDLLVAEVVRQRALNILAPMRRSRMVLCHGDFGVANVLIDPDNKWWLLDWEMACAGPRVLDFAKAANRVARFGAPEQVLTDMLETYNSSMELRHKISAEAVDRVRPVDEAISVLHGLAHREQSPAHEQEAQVRVATLLAEANGDNVDDFPLWRSLGEVQDASGIQRH